MSADQDPIIVTETQLVETLLEATPARATLDTLEMDSAVQVLHMSY